MLSPLTSEGMACACRPARYTKPGVRLQDAHSATASFECLRQRGLLRTMLCGRPEREIHVGNWSSVKGEAIQECAALHMRCTAGRGTGVAWQQPSMGAATSGGAPSNSSTASCAFLAFHHIDKAGGTTIREWMKQLELGPDGFEFLSSYSPRSCLAHHPKFGVTQCGDMSTERRLMHEAIDAALSCSVAEQPAPRFRLMSEYHAFDAIYNMRAMAHRLPRWRDLAAPRGCKVLVVALVREPSRWYVSWVAYLAAVFKKQPRGGTLESAIRAQPNHQAALIRTHWQRDPMLALDSMDLLAPLESIGTFAALICFELGIRACPPLARTGAHNGFHRTTCVRGLGQALRHNGTRVIDGSYVRTEADLLTLCQNATSLAARLARSESLQAAIGEHAQLDSQIYRLAGERFESRVARARAAGFEGTPTGVDGAAARRDGAGPSSLPYATYEWAEMMPPFPPTAVRVGQPLGLPSRSKCTLPPGLFAYTGNKVLVPAGTVKMR